MFVATPPLNIVKCHATHTPDDASHEEPPFPESGPPLTDPAPRHIPVYISTMKWLDPCQSRGIFVTNGVIL